MELQARQNKKRVQQFQARVKANSILDDQNLELMVNDIVERSDEFGNYSPN